MTNPLSCLALVALSAITAAQLRAQTKWIPAGAVPIHTRAVVVGQGEVLLGFSADPGATTAMVFSLVLEDAGTKQLTAHVLPEVPAFFAFATDIQHRTLCVSPAPGGVLLRCYDVHLHETRIPFRGAMLSGERTSTGTLRVNNVLAGKDADRTLVDLQTRSGRWVATARRSAYCRRSGEGGPLCTQFELHPSSNDDEAWIVPVFASIADGLANGLFVYRWSSAADGVTERIQIPPIAFSMPRNAAGPFARLIYRSTVSAQGSIALIPLIGDSSSIRHDEVWLYASGSWSKLRVGEPVVTLSFSPSGLLYAVTESGRVLRSERSGL